MRTFLGVLMVVIVSGDTETIEGILGDSVLLPCNCSGRALDKEFRWQVNTRELVLTYSGTTLDFYGTYKGRGKIFVDKDRVNCSVLLTNITADDQGTYKCMFHQGELFQRLEVNLQVSASYYVCQKNKSSLDFQCDVRGSYGEAEIQWMVDKQLLTNSPTTQIIHTYSLDGTPGLHHFKSELKLISKLDWTSAPTCYVKAKNISTIINNDCEGKTAHKTSNQPKSSMRYLKIIPIVLVLVLSLFLWHRQKSSQ